METAIIERPAATGEGANESSIVMLDVGLIDPNPANPRRDVGDVSELADSIRVQGIRQNLLVTPAPQDATCSSSVIAASPPPSSPDWAGCPPWWPICRNGSNANSCSWRTANAPT